MGRLEGVTLCRSGLDMAGSWFERGVFLIRAETSTPEEYLYFFRGVLKRFGAGAVVSSASLATSVDASGASGLVGEVVDDEAREDRFGGDVPSAGKSTVLSRRRACARAERKCAGETDEAF